MVAHAYTACWMHLVWTAKTGIAPNDSAWAHGYGAFSVSPLSVDRVVRYIARQEAHHRETSFRAEYEFMTERVEHATVAMST